MELVLYYRMEYSYEETSNWIDDENVLVRISEEAKELWNPINHSGTERDESNGKSPLSKMEVSEEPYGRTEETKLPEITEPKHLVMRDFT